MKKDFLSVADLTREEFLELMDISSRMKKYPFGTQLKGKTIALLFEKPSTRTRMSFEAGIAQLSGYPMYIDSSSTQISRGELIEDVAKVMEKYVDAICARVSDHRTLELLSKYASVPVISMLSDLEHPCQALADIFTIKERFGKFEGIKLAYIGDGNNVCSSLLLACGITGINISVSTPKGYEPNKRILSKARDFSQKNKSKVSFTNRPTEAAKNADVIYTDVWVSMGEEKENDERMKAFMDFQINKKLARHAKKDFVFMHCLPAHRGLEVTSEIMDGEHSIVWEQAGNRLHVQKALLLRLFNMA
ncbi:MAG: ornithine carbamoyltransferase [Candidatus Aenigmarchaeota archaeon]|nr:ornithine carbamoyltransferase [Candidatus Aenigmarchaeota archaeon]